MKRAKKLLAFMLCLVMLCGWVMPTVQAATDTVLISGNCGTNVTYTLYSDGEMVISGTGAMASYSYVNYEPTMPWVSHRSKITKVTVEDGVTSVGQCTFIDCGNITEITLGRDVEKVGNIAFRGCNEVKKITIGPKLKQVEKAFYTPKLEELHISDLKAFMENGVATPAGSNDYVETNLYLNGTKLTEIVIPAGIAEVTGVLAGIEGITSITVPEGVVSFAGCQEMSDLTTVNLPESLEYLGTMSGNTSLASVAMPNSVRTMGEGIFSGCTSLKNVSLSTALTMIPKNSFAGCTSLAEIALPENITEIGEWAFSRCTALQSVALPKGLMNIGANAFYGCSVLPGIVVPNGVTAIGSNAFNGCVSLTNVTLPDTLEILDGFTNCSVLKEVTVPNSVTDIGASAFSGCTSLTKINIPAAVTAVGASAFENCKALTALDFAGDISVLPKAVCAGCTGLVSVTLPDTLAQIGEAAFKGCSALVSADIPEGVTVMEREAFSGCTSLEKIIIPEGVTVIPSSAFVNCAVKEVVIPAGVAEIGSSAFSNCNALDTITFVGDAPSIATDAFFSVKAECIYPADNETYTAEITTVDFGGELLWTYEGMDGPDNTCGDNITWALSEDGVLTLAGSGAMDDYSVEDLIYAPWYEQRSAIKTVSMSDGITHIGDAAFYNCGAITTINFPASLTSIGMQAFQNSNQLTKVKVPEGVTEIGKEAFRSCYNLKTLVLPDSLTYIPEGLARESKKLETVNLPVMITRIEDNAFDGCFALRSLVLPEGLLSIGNRAFALCGPKDMYGLYYSGCSNFSSVTLPSTLKTIGESAFHACQSLTSITVPDSVTSIEDGAFMQCRRITQATISQSIEYIGADAFNQCVKLTGVTFRWNAPTIESSAFSATSGNTITCTYPGNNEAWTADKLQNYGGKLVWVDQTMEKPTVGGGDNTGSDGPESDADSGSTGDSTGGGADSSDSGSDSNSGPNSGGNTGSDSGTDSESNSGSNPGGSGSGGGATAELTILEQPKNQTVAVNETATFGVSASGGNLQYQWQYSTDNGHTWNNCNDTGANTNVLSVMADKTLDGALYRCMVTDIESNVSLSSNIAVLAVTGTEFAITRQPVDAYAKLNERYCAEVIATGEGLKYQWYFRNDGASGWSRSGVTDNTYDDIMTKARAYREVYCVITDASGATLKTDTVKLLPITEELTITQQPADAPAKLGEMFCAEVIAEGDGLKYQWYFKNRGTDTWYRSGVRDNTYDDIMTEARYGREIYCVITDAWGNTVTTDTVTLVGVPSAELAITQQPADAPAKLGEMFCAEVIAEGDGLKYQWYFKNRGTDTWYRSGVRDNTYDDIMTEARYGREIYCAITDAWGNTVTTDTVTLVGVPTAELAITQQPADAPAKLGEMFCAEVIAEGDGLKYQWYFKNSGTDTWHRSGVRDNTYDDIMTGARADREIYCIITDIWGNTVTTDTVTLQCIKN